MRKLYYEGINKDTNELIETYSYEVKKQAEKDGFTFTEKFEEIDTRSDKEKEWMNNRIEKIRMKTADALN